MRRAGGLIDRSSRPRTVRQPTLAATVELVIALRRQRWNSIVRECSYSNYFDILADFCPDLCIFVGSILPSEILLSAMLSRARKVDANIVVWLLDDPYEFDCFGRLDGLVDLILTTDKAACYHYPSHLPVAHMPLAAPRGLLSQPHDRRGPPFFFAGYPYENRVTFFSELDARLPRAESSKGLVVGPGWPTERVPFARNEVIDTFALNRFYKSGSVTFYLGRNLSLLNNRYGIRPSTPGPRLFEAAAAFACQVALTPGLELLDYFEPDSEIVFVDSAAEAADQCLRLMRDARSSLALGERAHRRVLSDHLYVHRIAALCDILNRGA